MSERDEPIDIADLHDGMWVLVAGESREDIIDACLAHARALRDRAACQTDAAVQRRILRSAYWLLSVADQLQPGLLDLPTPQDAAHA